MYHKASVPKNFAKLTGKYLCGSLFSTKLQVCILKLFLKKRLWYRCFLMNSKRYLRHLFHRTPPGDSFCSTEKYFTNTIVKSPLKKEKKKWKQLVRKTTTHAEKTWTLQKFRYSSFLCFPWYNWKHVFLETMQSHWGFIYKRKLFLTFSKLTLILVNTRIFVKK